MIDFNGLYYLIDHEYLSVISYWPPILLFNFHYFQSLNLHHESFITYFTNSKNVAMVF
jgi:hypothetical protein